MWTIKEKRLLLQGLRKYSSKNIDKLQELIPTKTSEEISEALKRHRTQARAIAKSSASVKIPVQHWTDEATRLVKDVPDVTGALTTALEMIAHEAKSKDTKFVRYSAMYMYLRDLVKQEPTTTPLTSQEATLIWHVLCQNLQALNSNTLTALKDRIKGEIAATSGNSGSDFPSVRKRSDLDVCLNPFGLHSSTLSAIANLRCEQVPSTGPSSSGSGLSAATTGPSAPTTGCSAPTTGRSAPTTGPSAPTAGPSAPTTGPSAHTTGPHVAAIEPSAPVPGPSK